MERLVLKTPWLSPSDDLGAALAAAMPPFSPGDVLAVAEKVVIVTSGRMESAGVPGLLARILARGVRPVGNSRGLSVPEKMQYVLDHVGVGRVLFAAAVGAVSRPFVAGAFYRVAGSVARDLDGLRGAYSAFLLPPLLPAEARLVAHHLASRLGVLVAIVDINDRGGSVRGCSPGCPPDSVLLAALADNPLGQAYESTPAVLLTDLE